MLYDNILSPGQKKTQNPEPGAYSLVRNNPEYLKGFLYIILGTIKYLHLEGKQYWEEEKVCQVSTSQTARREEKLDQ